VTTQATRTLRRGRRRLAASIRDRQWALPLIGAIAGIVLGLALFDVEFAAGGDWAITVSQSRATLAALVALMFTILSVSLSLTTLSLDNVSSHFSLRMLTVSVTDYRTKVATSVFALAVSFIGVELFKLTDFSSDDLTPRGSFIVAVALIVCSGVALFWQLNYTIQSLRLDRALSRLERVILRTARGDERRFRGWTIAARPEASDGRVPVLAARSGYIVEVDLDVLRDAASVSHEQVVISSRVGDPVVVGDEIGWVGGDGTKVSAQVLDNVRSGAEVEAGRAIAHDVGFGIRILVDIASLALSPAVNDPYTGVQVVDTLTIVLADLAGRHLGPRALASDGGVIAWAAAPTLADHLGLATAQISRYGATEPSVIDALVRLCDTVERCATSEVERDAAACRRLEVLAVASRPSTVTGSER
jgi:uncharacterized membrane protein